MSVVSLRLPESLHRELRALASQEGVSLNQLIVLAAGEKVAVLRHEESWLHHRAARGSRAGFLRALSEVPDAPPVAGDELP
jgi:hypothetical protein